MSKRLTEAESTISVINADEIYLNVGSNHSSNMNQLVQSSKRAHLFILYPTLLALLSLGEDSNRLPLSASTEYSQNAGSAATRSRTQLARQCLDVLGKEFIFSQ